MDKEAQKHLRERETILKILPYSIVIGPYQVNVEGVRDQLSTKRLELASSILSLIAKKLKKMADEVCP